MSGAGSARRSSLPLGLNGKEPSTINAKGTMYSGSDPLKRAQVVEVGIRPSAATRYAINRLRPGWPRSDNHGVGDAGVLGEQGLDLARLDPEAADLDLVSTRPMNSSWPSLLQRTRSPVRYTGCPGATDSPRTAARSARLG